ncbi:MAG: hypothetical protein AB7G47_01205 [Mycolicibacterium sp.]|uniref:hypothetical protein n=1 Tax=Mycolicibacterium sp. TaxID=2320850 RepID=UPI003D143CCE
MALTTPAVAMGLALPSTASAQPSLPDPFLVPDIYAGALDAQGAYAFDLTLIESPPPATTDARGVGVTSNATGAQSLKGLPGSMLGNSDPDDAPSSPASRVTVGNIRPLPASLGINISGGPTAVTTLEDPQGQPPTAFTDPESTVTTEDDSGSSDASGSGAPVVMPQLVEPWIQ